MPPRACGGCLSSPDPAACLACAKAPALKRSLLDAVLQPAYEAAPADGCAACAHSSTPKQCTACILGSKPCARCALQPSLQPGSQLDVGACISCTERHGEQFVQACTSCAGLAKKPSAVARCMACVSRAAPAACNATGYLPSCWNPANAGAYVCAKCATDAVDFDTCAACVSRRPYSASCESCASLPGGAAVQARCYACAAAAASPSTGCSDCPGALQMDSRSIHQCLSCLVSNVTTTAGKQWCFGCMNWRPDAAARGRCVKCLGRPAADDNFAQACSKA